MSCSCHQAIPGGYLDYMRELLIGWYLGVGADPLRKPRMGVNGYVNWSMGGAVKKGWGVQPMHSWLLGHGS